jgi:glycine cleavage system H protein
MKEITELTFPDDIKYSKDHEWVKMEDQNIRIGISDFAQDQLGDIVFVDLPKVGTHLVKNAEFGTVESVKAVSELFMPIDGIVTAINLELEEAPELVNQDPYGNGWMMLIKPDDISQINQLKSKDTYLDSLKGS